MLRLSNMTHPSMVPVRESDILRNACWTIRESRSYFTAAVPRWQKSPEFGRMTEFQARSILWAIARIVFLRLRSWLFSEF